MTVIPLCCYHHRIQRGSALTQTLFYFKLSYTFRSCTRIIIRFRVKQRVKGKNCILWDPIIPVYNIIRTCFYTKNLMMMISVLDRNM